MAKRPGPSPPVLPQSLADLQKLAPPAPLRQRDDLPKSFDEVLEQRDVPDWVRAAEAAFVRMANGDPQRLLQYPNVIGGGIGVRMRSGEPTDEVTVTVLVEKKVATEKLGRKDRIPEGWELEGVGRSLPTDVVPLAKTKKRQGCQRRQPATFDPFPLADFPLQGGIEIGTAGLDTFGTVTNFWGPAGNTRWTTNNHVIQDGVGFATGQNVIQPQIRLGTTTVNQLGDVDRAFYIVPGIFSGALVEHLDAAGGDLNLQTIPAGRQAPNVARNQQCTAGRFQRLRVNIPGRRIRCSSVTSIVRDGVTIVPNGFLSPSAIFTFGGLPAVPILGVQLFGGISLHRLPNDDGDSGGLITSEDGREALDVLWGGDDRMLTLANSVLAHAFWLGVRA